MLHEVCVCSFCGVALLSIHVLLSRLIASPLSPTHTHTHTHTPAFTPTTSPAPLSLTTHARAHTVSRTHTCTHVHAHTHTQIFRRISFLEEHHSFHVSAELGNALARCALSLGSGLLFFVFVFRVIRVLMYLPATHALACLSCGDRVAPCVSGPQRMIRFSLK